MAKSGPRGEGESEETEVMRVPRFDDDPSVSRRRHCAAATANDEGMRDAGAAFFGDLVAEDSEGCETRWSIWNRNGKR